jgi:hypothetical protein
LTEVELVWTTRTVSFTNESEYRDPIMLAPEEAKRNGKNAPKDKHHALSHPERTCRALISRRDRLIYGGHKFVTNQSVQKYEIMNDTNVGRVRMLRYHYLSQKTVMLYS